MSSLKKPKVKYLKDYKPSNYLIDRVELFFDLEDLVTTVTSKMHVYKNPLCKKSDNHLTLDGVDLSLKSVKINDELLSARQYEVQEESLVLINVPDDFLLEIVVEIKPQENKALMGLYQSRGIYCTQCEPEGFRHITYFLDRPDVPAKFTTTLSADKTRYPILLSNGNLIDSGELTENRHWMKWEDPFFKPCYLFALVAGDLEFLEDYFVTCSDRKITLRIFYERGYRDRCEFAMEALKKAMRWDEENYGREYDLDLFMIVVVDDFNSGAMENKGLNIFNSKCLFANSKTATDTEYDRITVVVAHEYFHNWTGDRVTCRDWFQLSLKEGLTVFRDQTFSEDVTAPAVARIYQVQRLRDLQFPEDAGPLAHSVRPDSYIAINNFYTMTVYEKGAEVIRMMRTILGREKFRRGMDLYFERHDGQAVTCDDFVKALEEGGQTDLTQFRLWYSQAGTPELFITDHYDAKRKEYHLTVKQTSAPTPDQPHKKPLYIPLLLGLLDPAGNDLIGTVRKDIQSTKQTFVFENILEKPTPSFLRDFSAPVKLHYDYTDEDLSFLMQKDSNDFSRWEAGQLYAVRVMQSLKTKVPAAYIEAMQSILVNEELDKALKAQMFMLPSEIYLAQWVETIDVDAIFNARELVQQILAEKLKKNFLEIYHHLNNHESYEYNVPAVARRSLKNICLFYLAGLNQKEMNKLCVEQFQQADNMTDRFAALQAISHVDCHERQMLLDQFYQMYQTDVLVIDKWFALQAMSKLPHTVNDVEKLLKHPAFNIKNPNRVYALLVSFAKFNPVRFHDMLGAGYRLLTDQVLQIDRFNPHVAARILTPLTAFKQYDAKRKKLMKEELVRLSKEKISKNVYELVKKSLS